MCRVSSIEIGRSNLDKIMGKRFKEEVYIHASDKNDTASYVYNIKVINYFIWCLIIHFYLDTMKNINKIST